ncbi:hypothetical protein [Actinoplanes sp. CA-252034]|uniref:hypothetical protein n=1 Tax=Actinoplanes sp. CA-252034 TaxID=3239906 RepID=UPI003D95586A
MAVQSAADLKIRRNSAQDPVNPGGVVGFPLSCERPIGSDSRSGCPIVAVAAVRGGGTWPTGLSPGRLARSRERGLL